MSTERSRVEVAGIPVEVVRKDIKNLHLAVYPPDGRVRVAAPVHVDDDAVRLAVINRLSWIRTQQQRFDEQPRQTERRCVSGESHFFLGRRYTLQVDEVEAAPAVRVASKSKMAMTVRPGTPPEVRREVLAGWYRHQLRDVLDPMLDRWQTTLGVAVNHWAVRQMRTKWGSCNADRGRVLFNTELAKKPVPAIEYIVVHELIHLLERRHDERFAALLEQHMPDWEQRRTLLNSAPLAHEDWSY
jgi:predicted metal-dependent hydrolase